MPELISNPQSEPEPQWSDGSDRAAHDGPDGLPHPGIVIRYDAATDLSDREDDPDADDGEEPEPDSEPASGGAVDRARAIVGAAARGLLALSWSCLLTAYRYPRWALVIVLSVVILGATALTRPGKATPTAKIPGESAAASAPGPDKGKDPQKAKEPPKGDQPALADAGSPPGAKAEDGHQGAKKDGEASASPPAPDPASAPGPAAPKVVDAGPTNSTTAEKGPSTNNSPPANREPVPAPPPLIDQTGAALLAGPPASQAPAPPPPSTAQAPAPAVPAPSPPETQGPPETTTAAVPGPNPGLPPLSGAESGPPPISGSAPSTTATTAQPAESTTPAPGVDGKRPGVAEAGNAPPSSPAPGAPAAGATGSGEQPAVPAEPGPPAQQPMPQPGPPAPGASPVPGLSNSPPLESVSPSPLPPVTAPSQPLEPPVVAPKSDPPAPAPAAPKVDPPAPAPATEVEKGHDEPAKAGENKGQATPKAEPPKPANPGDRPAIDGESKTAGPARPGPVQGSKISRPDLPTSPSEPLVKPEAPAPDSDHGREGAGAEKATANETNRPNLLDVHDLKPSQGGEATRAQGTNDRTAITAPKTEGSSPPSEEARTTVPAPTEISPAAPPASEPTGSRMPQGSATEVKGGDDPGASASEPSDSAGKPTRDPAEAGWVRIPNKGRIPSDMGSDLVASGEVVRGGSDPSRGRRAQDDRGIDVESGSPASRPGDTGARSAGRPVEGSRAGGRPSRVESSLHIVDHGENFWTISRLYYGDGRYYKALWKANSRKYPKIREIHVNDVILIPAVEDLDPAYIERPRRHPVVGRDEDSTGEVADGPEVSEPSGRGTLKSFPTTRTARRSDASQGGPGRGSDRVDATLELPVGEGDAGLTGDGRGPGEEQDEGPRSRMTARPRGGAPADRPMYKVRRYDTLRSIARDVLGDPRRADELYELNRDVITDPTRLVAGQLLELPEDADARRLTARDRYRGRD